MSDPDVSIPVPVIRALLQLAGAMLVLLGLVGCTVGVPEPRIKVLDSSLQPFVEAAAERWNAATGLQLRTIDQGENVTANWGIGRRCVRPQWGCNRLGGDGRMHITVAEWAAGYTDLPEAVLVHELGHAMGAEHSRNRGDAMYPDTAPGDCITARDIRKVCAMQLCEWQRPECS